MLIKKYLFLILGGLLLAGAGTAQTTEKEWCGYKGDSEWLDWYQRNTALFQNDGDADTSWLYVPMTLHLVGNNAGQGHFSIEQSIDAVCGMNSFFAPHHIRFFLMPNDAFRYYNNTSWYAHDWNGGSDMINTVLPGLENRFNAFVVSDPAENCGYSWQDVIVLKKSCSSANNTTWAHEAGHHFSLPHTFRGWEGFSWNYAQPAPTKVNNRLVEKTDGSNCYTAGDRFCDTGPDYLTNRWPCNDEKRSTTQQHDPNNVPFRSDATPLMSYAYDACQARFSQEQADAMRANLQSEHSQYLLFPAPVLEIDDAAQVELISPIDTAETVQYNHIELTWNPVPNAKYYVVEVGRTETFSTKFFSATLVNETSVTITKGIPNNWNLFWRVRAYNDWDLCQPYDQAQIGVFRTQNLLATNELERSAIIELMPNPVIAGTPALLKVDAESAMDLAVYLNDAAGRVCFQQRLRLYSGENQFEVPTAGLNAGIYTIVLQNEKGATVKRMAVVE